MLFFVSKGEIQVEQEKTLFGANMTFMSYMNSLNVLFQELNKLNNVGSVNAQNNYEQLSQRNSTNDQTVEQNNIGTGISVQSVGAGNVGDANQFAQNFQDKFLKRSETLCEIGFWCSLLGLFVSFGHGTLGLITYVMDFYFASLGLKTKKRKKAIMTIIISILSILITISKFF